MSQWSVVSGQWSVVSGQWSVVSGQWSVVSCQWSVVSGQLSVVISYSSSPPYLPIPLAPLRLYLIPREGSRHNL